MIDRSSFPQGQLPGSLELAYVGDTLWDLLVRTRLVRQGGTMKTLHRAAVQRVCAHAQSDALGRIEPLLNKIQALGMTHCAITDHGAMYGVVDFYQQALKRNIHPVIGCEVYICHDLTDKTSGARDYSHLILLCENQKGY